DSAPAHGAVKLQEQRRLRIGFFVDDSAQGTRCLAIETNGIRQSRLRRVFGAILFGDRPFTKEGFVLLPIDAHISRRSVVYVFKGRKQTRKRRRQVSKRDKI